MGPGQPLAVGVIVYVTVPAVVPELLSVCAGMFPVPLAVNPVMPAVPAAVQLKVVPGVVEVSEAIDVVAPLQIDCAAGNVTCGVGSIIIVKFTGVPLQPLAVGVIANTTESITLPVLVIVWAGMVPVPLAVKPVRLPLELAIQAKVEPAVVEVGVTAVLVPALHMVCEGIGLTFGNGFTVIVSFTAGPGQPLAVGVIT